MSIRILSVTAQKPDSTGSGVFLSELVKGFDALGCPQAVICGITAEDPLPFPNHIQVFPVMYSSPELPFPVCGMSDEMPYDSTRYRDLTEAQTVQLKDAFLNKVTEAVDSFRPDVILCHHLYFLASLIRQHFPHIPVYGQCHGSDLRQIETNAWLREWIRAQIPNLDGIFALHAVQQEKICSLFDLSPDQVQVMGTGYNSSVFFQEKTESRDPEKTRFLFAGKLSEKKGIYSLLACLSHLKNPLQIEVYLAGGYSTLEELSHLHALAAEAPCKVELLGRLDQATLAGWMNACDVFILPSFYEGLPLVLIEAMACGMKTICTDLPGIQPWLDQAIPGSGAIFVTPPAMRNTDEPIPDSLPDFEKRLAAAMEDAISAPLPNQELVRRLSWGALCRRLLHIFDSQEVSTCW